jgi:predicted phage terminase large subunit-like protein
VGAKVGKDVDGEWYILDVVRERFSASKVRQLVKDTARSDGYACKIRIEESRDGAGKSVVEFYKEDPDLRAYDIDGVRAEGQKYQRAMPYSALQIGGHFHLPSGAPWLRDFIDEHKQAMDVFRWPKHDDQIDVVAYAVLEMHDAGRVTVIDARSYRPESNRAVVEMARKLGMRVVA